MPGTIGSGTPMGGGVRHYVRVGGMITVYGTRDDGQSVTFGVGNPPTPIAIALDAEVVGEHWRGTLALGVGSHTITATFGGGPKTATQIIEVRGAGVA